MILEFLPQRCTEPVRQMHPCGARRRSCFQQSVDGASKALVLVVLARMSSSPRDSPFQRADPEPRSVVRGEREAAGDEEV